MSTVSPNLSLPYIQQNQAQKHVTHNEGMRLLDGVVQLSVLSRAQTAPPANPVADTRDGLKQFITYLADNNIAFGYEKVHLTLGEGNFVFTQSEGIYDGAATAFYDLWRVEDGKIAEHWDVVQTIPEEFAHDNGMF